VQNAVYHVSEFFSATSVVDIDDIQLRLKMLAVNLKKMNEFLKVLFVPRYIFFLLILFS